MLHYAVGIIQHPITGRWQPWVYTEDDGTISLACLSSHNSKAFAHLVAQLCLDAHHAGIPFDIDALLKQSQESDVPDPLPQATSDALIADVHKKTATAASPTATILGFS
jgi:hypothetical protein